MSLDKNMAFNIVLGVMIVITVTALSALGESRLDVYVSMFTVEYFAALAIFRPRRRFLDVIAIALLAVFAMIVALRVAEVLAG
jgi:hypothetical protein